MADYANPDVLVTTDWVGEHTDDPKVRIVESDEDVLLYDTGHVPGAVKVDWHTELNDERIRDYIKAVDFGRLMSTLGIATDTTVVFYGDRSNWWACYAYWVFRLFGHDDLRVMNGGRKKWLDEKRPISREVPSYPPTRYRVAGTHSEIRAFRDDVLKHIGKPDARQERFEVPWGRALVDVRSPGEYSGELLHMPDYPQEGALRGGHIPGAVSIPWSKAVTDEGTFKPADEIKNLYESQGITPDKDIIAYCRIGERSSLTWFVLHELMGYKSVRNYDGSWTEWGNVVGLPIVNPSLDERRRKESRTAARPALGTM
ncbi:MAG: thiosulfate sulfurtransferase [Acidobacteria bacterium RBG_13_68_16]|jgi:thiosulfate/3-mercaptopyruvate sulfurtransferase|nr:MAG: thiosulfate sulfurtransferase [Acidobacteria bacterium RBG_13_68_16]